MAQTAEKLQNRKKSENFEKRGKTGPNSGRDK
jgi:hypothetical protein